MIETARLLLRRWEERDRGPFAALNADPEVIGDPGFPSRGESDGLIDAFEERWRRGRLRLRRRTEVGWRFRWHGWHPTLGAGSALLPLRRDRLAATPGSLGARATRLRPPAPGSTRVRPARTRRDRGVHRQRQSPLVGCDAEARHGSRPLSGLRLSRVPRGRSRRAALMHCVISATWHPKAQAK